MLVCISIVKAKVVPKVVRIIYDVPVTMNTLRIIGIRAPDYVVKVVRVWEVCNEVASKVVSIMVFEIVIVQIIIVNRTTDENEIGID